MFLLHSGLQVRNQIQSQTICSKLKIQGRVILINDIRFKSHFASIYQI